MLVVTLCDLQLWICLLASDSDSNSARGTIQAVPYGATKTHDSGRSLRRHKNENKTFFWFLFLQKKWLSLLRVDHNLRPAS
jgi:hypothetical protein